MEQLWFETEHDGAIIDWSPEALSLLGYRAKAAPGRLLPVLFIEDRPNAEHLTRVMLGHPVDRVGTIRPRERRGVRVQYRIELAADSTKERPILRWSFQRI